jgi:hypothetical protein
MMLGHKDNGIKFNSGSEWLNSINWKTSLSKIWMTTENDYEWMFKLAIRDDIFRISNQVTYMKLGLNSMYDDRGINSDTCLEMGDRIHLNENIYLILFVSHKHFHDWYSLGEEEDFFSAGLGLEIGLGHENPNNFSNLEKTKFSWTPELHITGDYTDILDNADYGHSSDVTVDLALLKLDKDKKLSLNTYAGILTLPHDLNPFTVMYKIGPSLEIFLDNLYLRLFHSYSCLYNVEEEGVLRNYNLLGLQLGNNNVSYWNGNIKIGVYPSTINFDYWGDLQGTLGYNFSREGVIPYISCSGAYLQGDSSVFGHAIEGGIKIPGEAGSFIVYLCQQNDFDVFRFGKGTQKLVAIGVEF